VPDIATRQRVEVGGACVVIAVALAFFGTTFRSLLDGVVLQNDSADCTVHSHSRLSSA
jgi:hypothetical protein